MKRLNKTVDRLERLKQPREKMCHASASMDHNLCYWEHVPLCWREGYTPRGNLHFYLHDHREDTRKWNGKLTSALTTGVHVFRGKTTTNGNSSRIIQFPVGKPSDRMEGLNVVPDPLEEISSSCLQELSNDCHDQNYWGPASSHVEERENQIYWTVWISWPGTSDPQE